MSVTEKRGGDSVLGPALSRGRSAILTRWESAARPVQVGGAPDRVSLRHDFGRLYDVLVDVVLGRADMKAIDALSWAPVAAELEQAQALAALLREFGILRESIHEWLAENDYAIRVEELALLATALDRAADQAMGSHLMLRQRVLKAMDRIAHVRYRDRRVEEVLGSLGEIILEMGSADTVLLLLLEGDRLRVRASIGADTEITHNLAPAIGEGFVGEVARRRKPRILEGLDAEKLERARLPGLDVVVLYGVPLLADTELVGVALLGSRTATTLSDDERLLFRWMADRAGLIVDAVLADARSRAAAAITRAFAASSTFEAGAANLLAELGETLGWDVGVFWSVQDGRLRYLSGWAASPGLEQFLERSRRTSFAPGDHLPGEAWTSDRAEWISDIARDPVFSRGATAREVGLNSGMALALRGNREFFGVVEFFSHHVQSPAEAGLEVTRLVVPQVEQFMERVRAAEEVRRSREEAAEAARRQQLMADTSRALSETTELAAGLQEVTRLVTAHFAEWCTVQLVRGDALERVAWTHRDPEGARHFHERALRTPLVDLSEDTRAILFQGGSKLTSCRMRRGARADGEPVEDSVIVVALGMADRPIGMVRMGRGPRFPPFDDDELRLARDLAGRTAVVMENRRLQLDAEAAKRRLETVLGQLPAGVVLADAEGRIELANEVARPYLDQVQFPLTPDSPLYRALRGEVVTQEEVTRPLGDESRVLLTNAAPIADGGDAHDGAVVAFVDITDRKRSEEEMQRTSTFREQFLGVVSHDLRNPLTAIRMAAGLLARQPLEPAQLAVVARIRNSADRMTHMIEDLLDFTRGRLGGGIPVSPEDVDLNDIVRSTVDEMRVAHPEVPIETDLRGDLHGCWDSGRIAQLLSNLVGNAVNYRAPDTTVTVLAHGDGPTVELAVRNFGPVIAPDTLDHLFDPFRRDAQSQGLGLGLFIVEQITRAHGGDIEVRSSEQEGTIFRVRIPRRPSA